MDVSNRKQMTKEQYELFVQLKKDREDSARVFKKPSMEGIEKSITDKYSEKAHFVYELLQNADDAKAAKARFVLDKNGLIFAHKGTIHFSISDPTPTTEEEDKESGQLGHINSITSIGNTTKFESEIGKFGIGFKSVFQYTNTPHIYDPPFIFKIERFIVPVLLESDYSERLVDETLFYFPFDSEKAPPQKAYEEIITRLQKLNNPLLFLRYLKEITWEDREGKSGVYFKNAKLKKAGRIVSLISKVNGKSSKDRFIVFDKKIADPNNTKVGHTISIAFGLAPEGKLKISSNHKFPAYCFFATREPTELKFIIQAPFLLTDSREEIKQGEEWNKYLIEQAASLVADSLSKIKDIGLLKIDLLNILPISREDYQDDHMFYPVFDVVLKKLKSKEKLLPANDGSFINFKQALLAKSKDLMDLLETKQLSLLFGKKGCHWFDSKITEENNSKLRKYLVEELNVEEINYEVFANRFTKEFISKQTDKWVIMFYKYLPEIWKYSFSELRNKPFLRLENNSHVAPFDNNDNPQVYLPGSFKSDFPTVKKTIANDKKVKEFLKEDLGLDEPDTIAEVNEFILPKYNKARYLAYLLRNETYVSDEDNLIDVENILNALKSASEDKKENFIDNLKHHYFLKLIRVGTKEISWGAPDLENNKVYLSKSLTGNENIDIYFEGNPNVYFLHNMYKGFNSEQFLELGCLDTIHVEYAQPNHFGRITICNNHGCHKRGLNGFDPDFDIDGLEYALKNFTIEKAQIIWNILKQYYKSVYGIVESSSYKDYRFPSKAEQASKAGELLRKKRWLPDKDKKDIFYKPSELILSELPETFDTKSQEASNLAEKLGFKKDSEEQLLNKLSPENKRRFELAKKIPLEKLEKVAKEFEHTEFPEQYVTDKERRKSKNIENYDRSPKKEFQERERLVRISQEQIDKRTSLREWYQDREGRVICQICKSPSSFKNRQGKYYIVAMEMIVDDKEYDANALALCPVCAAKYLYGEKTNDEGIKKSFLDLFSKYENGKIDRKSLAITIELCGERAQIQFVEKHLIDLLPVFHKK